MVTLVTLTNNCTFFSPSDLSKLQNLCLLDSVVVILYNEFFFCYCIRLKISKSSLSEQCMVRCNKCKLIVCYVFRGVLHIAVVLCPPHHQPLPLMEAPPGHQDLSNNNW